MVISLLGPPGILKIREGRLRDRAYEAAALGGARAS